MNDLLMTLLVWTCLAGLARAGEFKYPKAAPVLTVTMPDGWTVTEVDGPDHPLIGAPPKADNYSIGLVNILTFGNVTDLKSLLPQVARSYALASGMTNITVSGVREGPIGDGPRVFTRVTVSGKHEDEAAVFTFYAFSMSSPETYYALGVGNTQALIDAHQSEFEAVAKSIRPAP